MGFSKFIYESIKKGESLDTETIKQVYHELNLIRDRVYCDVCGFTLKIHSDKSKSMFLRLWCQTCKVRQDIRKYTPFKNFRLNIFQMLQVIILFLENKSIAYIQEITRVSNKTILKVFNMIRECYKKNLDSSLPIGRNCIVEISEG